jgi:hypothetical protein
MRTEKSGNNIDAVIKFYDEEAKKIQLQHAASLATTSSTISSQTPVDVLLDLALCGYGEPWGLRTLLTISSESALYGRKTIDLFVGHLAKRLLQRALGYSVNLFKNAIDLVKVICDTKAVLSAENNTYIGVDLLGNSPTQQYNAGVKDETDGADYPPIYLCYVIEAVNRTIADACSTSTSISNPAPLRHDSNEGRNHTKHGSTLGGEPLVSTERMRALCDLLQELIEFLVSTYCRMLSAQSPAHREGAYMYIHLPCVCT